MHILQRKFSYMVKYKWAQGELGSEWGGAENLFIYQTAIYLSQSSMSFLKRYIADNKISTESQKY